MKKVKEGIYLYTGIEKKVYDVDYIDNKYYFLDETSNYVGPCTNIDECEKALNEYIVYLNNI